MKTCFDFKDESGFPGCCDSCHDEQDMGFGDLCGGDFKGEEVHVCCKVLLWLQDGG